MIVSFSFWAWALSNLFWDLAPLLNPPIYFLSFWFSLKLVLKALARLARSPSSSFLTSVKTTAAAFFWWTSWPNLAFPLTKQYGISIFLQRVGNQTTSSIGSTLLAITTSLAFFSSISLVTWFKPNLRWKGLVFWTVFSKLDMKVTFSLILSLLDKTSFSWLGIFRRILFQQSEKHAGLIFIKCFLELSDKWGNFYSGEENSFLSLECNVFRPSDKSSKISLGLNIISDSEVARSALEERVWFLLNLLHCSFSLGSFHLS